MANKKLNKPFFAKFLENQMKETDKVKGGAGDFTSPSKDLIVKPTKPTLDTHHTMKYPSDGDEHAI